jgi:hypothetical protein
MRDEGWMNERWMVGWKDELMMDKKGMDGLKMN